MEKIMLEIINRKTGASTGIIENIESFNKINYNSFNNITDAPVKSVKALKRYGISYYNDEIAVDIFMVFCNFNHIGIEITSMDEMDLILDKIETIFGELFIL